MKLIMKQLSCLLVLFFGLGVLFGQETTKVMTYNIKLDYPKEGKHSWDQRKALIIGQINFYEPDVFGVQEALPNQMAYLDSTLVNYSYVGVGRDDGKNSGEYSAIFYKKVLLEVIKSSTFWLSETPDKVSMGWDAVCNRVCTYALFKSKKTNKYFWVFNTHFDHVGKQAKKESPKLILQKIQELNSKNYPTILMGDFNLKPETENIQFIKKHFNDSKEVSEKLPFGPLGTFNGFHFDKPVTLRIDYIFVSKKTIKVSKYAVLSDSKDCKYPSDHLPVFVFLKF
ncbi:endonuclease/exonuclease/phosphatase family protein [Flavivirga abyssicola]|uniref:endonuclease/exonuclease/phosphatase family protein n=1 Tax=Flavivirga abyssicola TaxID=3063533 RepID=UPI0026DFB618|nr:endonuclease/exonuclease/phosphatase family protein [Flavivirga sp. MEBiC07777]WVK14159.1 endonuclease/exonuclease/phosphatase family protein [Flavivirga sp. MEBiC07777]